MSRTAGHTLQSPRNPYEPAQLLPGRLPVLLSHSAKTTCIEREPRVPIYYTLNGYFSPFVHSGCSTGVLSSFPWRVYQ
jgi:hypothetical protein